MANSLGLLNIGVGLIGGLALFLYGMHTMSDGLKAAAGDRMKRLLAKLTTTRYSAVLTGAIVTAVVQSSSVTTVLIVGFVSTGLMTLGQSVGVIMGANIGSTVTAQIVAFKVTELAWTMVAVGFGLWAFPRRDVLRHYGAMIMGFGLLFLGLDQMGTATSPLRSFQPFIELMGRMDNPLLGILIGAVFTALVQSSAATTGIVIMLASQGFLSLEGGIALAIGANIGTCFTAILSALGKPPEAARAAVVHVLFNVIGALLWVGLIGQLADAAREISPARDDLAGVERLAAETPRQIANANTLFNVANTLLLIWFAGPIGHAATRLVPRRPSKGPPRVEPKFLDQVYLQTPSLAVDRVRMELVHMGECVMRMLEATPKAWTSPNAGDLRRIANMDDDVDRLHRAILGFIRDLSHETVAPTETERLEGLFTVADYLESTADILGTDVVAQGLRHPDRRADLGKLGEIGNSLWAAVCDSLRDVLRALSDDDPEIARAVMARKQAVHALADEAMGSLGRLAREDRIDLDGFRISADVVGQIKRLYYNVRKTAQIVARGAREGKDADG